MKQLNVLLVMPLLCCSMVLAACSPTVLTGSWRDPEYTGGSLKKVLVVSLSRNDLIRRMLEDEFARQLGEAGVQAVTSYSNFTVEQLKEQREEVAAKVKGLGFNQVIVTRLVDKRTEEVVQPGTVYGGGYYPGGWNGYYHDSWNVVYQTPVTYQVDIATLETKLFDLGTSKMIWSGLLETEIGGTAMSANKGKVIRSFVKVVVQDLEKERLL